jgi:hypothetical protein
LDGISIAAVICDYISANNVPGQDEILIAAKISSYNLPVDIGVCQFGSFSPVSA